jgi:hypothetical protein
VTVATFGLQHTVDDGFTASEAFWMTICSTIVSTITNFTLVWDFVKTPNFAKAGKSGFVWLHLFTIRVLTLVQAVASRSDNDLSSSLQ